MDKTFLHVVCNMKILRNNFKFVQTKKTVSAKQQHLKNL